MKKIITAFMLTILPFFANAETDLKDYENPYINEIAKARAESIKTTEFMINNYTEKQLKDIIKYMSKPGDTTVDVTDKEALRRYFRSQNTKSGAIDPRFLH